jgi:sarcosine oxidase subunit gamma
VVERLSALGALYREGEFGTLDAAGPGVILAERRPLAMVQVATGAEAGAGLRAGLAAVLGFGPAVAANRAASRSAMSILWLGPERWLVVAPETEEGALALRLRGSLGVAEFAVTDLGHGRTVLRVAGDRARDLLAKGCPIDLHPRSFPPDACAQSLLGHVGVLIHAVDVGPRFDLYVARSFALTAWEWLMESAAEYGCRVMPPIAE